MKKHNITREGILQQIEINENQLKFYSQYSNKLHCWSIEEWQILVDSMKEMVEKRKAELEEFDQKNNVNC